MADDEPQDEVELKIPEIWLLAKPPSEGVERVGPKMGPLMRFLGAIEDADEVATVVQERDPATGQSLLTWATLNDKFILVEWLYKRCGRSAFAFSDEGDKDITVFDKWLEMRKDALEREAERAANPPEEEEDGDEERPEEPPLEQSVYEALSEYHADWDARGQGLVKRIGELGVYQGARDASRVKNGIGQSLFVNGDMYTGQYVNNCRQGRGTYVWANDGVIYTGEWRNNLRWGVGRLVLPDGSRYLGGWLQDTMHGEGRYTYPDGSSYTGSWVRGIKDGFGVYQFNDGSQYIGTFIDGQFQQGEWRLSGGLTRYFGQFEKGVPRGKGVFACKYGTEGAFRQEGEYREKQWYPTAPIVSAKDPPKLILTVQGTSFPVSFGDSGRGYTIAQLSACLSFPPLLRWARGVVSAASCRVESVQIFSIRTSSNAIDAVMFDAVYHDARGRVVERLTKERERARVVVVLRCGASAVTLVESAPIAGLNESAALKFPTVRFVGDRLVGPVVDATAALRLSLSKAHVCPVWSAGAEDVERRGSAAEGRDDVWFYAQDIHADLMATLAKRLAPGGYAVPLTTLRIATIDEVCQGARDVTTLAVARRVKRMMASNGLPQATVEAQRPPTPLPPMAEPRPDVKPLLEALDASKSASKAEM